MSLSPLPYLNHPHYIVIITVPNCTTKLLLPYSIVFATITCHYYHNQYGYYYGFFIDTIIIIITFLSFLIVKILE